jgi:hypothetical protein
MDVENILKAINLADYDGIKRIEISISDLQTLRHEILNLYSKIDIYKKEKARLQSDYNKLLRLKNVSLECYDRKGDSLNVIG